MARFFGVLMILVVGAALGAGGMYTYLDRPAPQRATQTAALPRATISTPSLTGDGTVWVTFESGVTARRALGVVLREPDVVLVRFDDFVRAERGYWRSADGGRRELGPAVAYDLDVGLLAFAVSDDGPDGLNLSPDDGALYLGRDVAVVTGTTSNTAFVDSAAIENGLNDYRYYLKSEGRGDHHVAAVVLPDSRELVGLAARPTEGNARWLAIDAATLRDMLEKPLQTPVTSLARFSAQVFDQPQGLAVEFRQLYAAGRWEAALKVADRLRDRAPDLLFTPEYLLSVHGAMVQHARALIATDQRSAALSLLLRQVPRFGASEDVLRSLYALTATQRSHVQAITLLRELAVQNTGPFAISEADVTTVLREQVSRYVSSGQLSDDAALALLGDMAAFDDQYAPYQFLLGNLLFNSGRYGEAEFHLQRAVALDPAYAADVQRELNIARQRRQATTQIEAPLQSSGNSLYVNVRINGSAQSFRFLLDTGASYTAINTSSLLRLGMNEIFTRGAPPIELETANGRIYAQSFTLDSLDVAGAVVEQVPVVLLEDMGSLDGLLGLSFLRHFEVQINQRENLLLLTPH